MSEVLVGSPAGTIYGTYALAEIYIDSQYGAGYRAWEALAVAVRKRVLLSAAAYLNRQAWIADYDTFAERDALAAFPIASYELAALAASDPTVLSRLDQGSNIQSAGAGGASVTFFSPTSAARGSATVLPPILMGLVGAYLAISETAGPAASGGVSGSADNPFDGLSDFDRTGPY